MKRVLRTQSYLDDLDAIEKFIARDKPGAAADMWFHIDDQVTALTDPLFPRRTGRVEGTFELVAHENYLAIFEEDDACVIVLAVVHARMQFP
jgi:plasmid stabilization system protein ParE